jgi:microcystin-dependent protein
VKWLNLLNLFYPVGTIYMSVNNTNPGTFMGGTWAAWGSGRTPVGVDTGQTEFDTVEETGGAKTHTLAATEMPTHTHTQDSHNHTQASHNHTQNSHNHTQNAHDHSVRYKGFNVTVGSPGYYCLRRQDAADSYDGTDSDAAIAATATNVAATATNVAATATNNATTATNQDAGDGQAHNNLPPYITCYFWKRTA